MKNKKTIYILLPLVVLIWTLIFIRIFSYKNDDQNTYQPHEKITNNSEGKEVKIQYELLLDYPDPFLRKVKNSGRQNNSTAVNKPEHSGKTAPKPDKKKKEAIIPSLSYRGMMNNVQKGKTIGFVIVNNTSHMVCEGDEIDGISVVRIWKDSVSLSFDEKIFIVKK